MEVAKEKIKILEHKRIIVYEPIVCEDCGAKTTDYYEIKPAVLPVKTRKVCYTCITSVDSKYKHDSSFYFIDEIRKPIFGKEVSNVNSIEWTGYYVFS